VSIFFDGGEEDGEVEGRGDEETREEDDADRLLEVRLERRATVETVEAVGAFLDWNRV
jgi:hypothetical protein